MSKGGSRSVKTKVLLDTGSDRSFVARAIIDHLGIHLGDGERTLVTTLTGQQWREMSSVDLRIRGLSTCQSLTLTGVLVVDQLPCGLARSMANPTQLQRYPHLEGLTTVLASLCPVQLLIGQDNPAALVPLDSRVGPEGTPFAVKTRLGWAISGPTAGSAGLQDSLYFHCDTNGNTPSTEALLERLWSAEGGGTFEEFTQPMSVEDSEVIRLWEQQGKRENGHYLLPIPFKGGSPQLPDNKAVAQRRLFGLKMRLQKNDTLKAKYTIEMSKLVEKGYAERVAWRERVDRPGHTWYIPHHPVFNPHKPEKTRVVFDCALMYQGVSLNKEVAQGPDLTNRLQGVLLRFRREPVAVMADIEAMFHQVRVTKEHRDALRFLWWPDGDLATAPVTYRMTVHLFGGVWSPACASYALRRTFKDFGAQFPEAETHLAGFYVDDLLISLTNIEEATLVARQLQRLTACGGFRLTKWLSNRREVLSTISDLERHDKVKEIELQSSGLPVERALGLVWDLEKDDFGVKYLPRDRPVTKRGVLGVVSAVYDPLGFLCPVTVKAKLLFQDECRKKTAWDEPLCPANAVAWQQWLHGLEQLQELRIPRCYFPQGLSRMKHLQLHHFCDASQVAYAAVTYLRAVGPDGEVSCSFICGRSRLAPIKQLTVPRLELCAAVLAVKCDRMVRQELQVELAESVFWSDSMIVLGYITNTVKRFRTFVANRLAYIHETTAVSQWRHVRSEQNPADDATRGLTTKEMKRSRWLTGPAFLWLAPKEWVLLPKVLPVPADDPEVKRESTVLVSVDQISVHNFARLWHHYSSWYRLRRAVAWLRKGFQARRNREHLVLQQGLDIQDLEKAERAILQQVQKEAYAEEFKEITKQTLRRQSSLYRLEPYIRDGLIRVGGRLQFAQPEVLDPVLLPADHRVTWLIVTEVHRTRAGHSGREHTLALLRDRYWIPRPRSMLDRVLKRCVTCRRNNFRPQRQREADLPIDRLTPGGPPFRSTGLDAFGPFMVTSGRRRLKRFGCLFTCMRTRAVHLEVLDSLDADALLNAIRRFACRRGTPETLRSDNGTNMVAASKELKGAMRQLGQNEGIGRRLQKEGINWIFNPPGAPHMGGAWERQIGTAKKVMRAIIGTQSIDDYRLMTLFCEVEAVINSRPITPVSSDPRDFEALTPGHLLKGGVDPGFPARKESLSNAYKRRWQHVQVMTERFWRRFVKEYVPMLRRRHRYLRPQGNLKEGDMVILSNVDMPRYQWPLGRVIEVMPGADGLVRQARVQTANREYVRSVDRLCLLEGVTE